MEEWWGETLAANQERRRGNDGDVLSGGFLKRGQGELSGAAETARVAQE